MSWLGGGPLPFIFTFLPIGFLALYYVGLRLRSGPLGLPWLLIPGILGSALGLYLLYSGLPVQLLVLGSLALLSAAIIRGDPYAVLSLATLSIIGMLAGVTGLSSSGAPVSPTIYVVLATLYTAAFTLFTAVNTIASGRVYRAALVAVTLAAWGLSTVVYMIVYGGEALGYSVFQLSALASALALLFMRPQGSAWASFTGAAASLAAMAVDSAGLLSGDILGYTPYGLVLLACLLTVGFQVLVVYRSVSGLGGTPIASPGVSGLVVAVGLVALIAGLVGLATGQIGYGVFSSYIIDAVVFASLVVPLILIVRAAKYSPAVVVGSILTAWASYEAGVQVWTGTGYLVGVAAAWLALIAVYAVLSRSIARPLIAALAVLAITYAIAGMAPAMWSDIVSVSMPSEVGGASGTTSLWGTSVNVTVTNLESEASPAGPCVRLDLSVEVTPPNSSTIEVKPELIVTGESAFEDVSRGYEVYLLKWPSVYKVEVAPSTFLVGGLLASCDYAGLTGTIYEGLIGGQVQVTITRYNNVVELPLVITCIVAAALAADALISRRRR